MQRIILYYYYINSHQSRNRAVIPGPLDIKMQNQVLYQSYKTFASPMTSRLVNITGVGSIETFQISKHGNNRTKRPKPKDNNLNVIEIIELHNLLNGLII